MAKRDTELDLSRRRFLKRAGATSVAALAFPTIVPASVRGGARGVAPGDKIAVALVGAGPQGQGVMKGFLAEEDARVQRRSVGRDGHRSQRTRRRRRPWRGRAGTA